MSENISELTKKLKQGGEAIISAAKIVKEAPDLQAVLLANRFSPAALDDISAMANASTSEMNAEQLVNLLRSAVNLEAVIELLQNRTTP